MMKRYIASFSMSNRYTFNKLANISEQVIDHLIKVFLYPDNQEQTHWKKEIWNFLKSVPKLKSSNKFPSSKQLLKCIWNSYEDVIYKHIDLWVDEIDEIALRFEYKDIYDAIHEYMVWLADELSKYGIVRSSQVYDKIEELRLKYLNY